MVDNVRRAEFEKFLRMRLEGRSDVTYRAYDLLANSETRVLRIVLRYCGQVVAHVHGELEALHAIQALAKSWGFHRPISDIEKLANEFYSYYRLKTGAKKKWPYRDPDEARKLYDQNERIKDALIQSSM